MAQLKREIDIFGANEKEAQTLTARNVALESEVTTTRREIQRLYMGIGTQNVTLDNAFKVLRSRNGNLVNEVDKLKRNLDG